MEITIVFYSKADGTEPVVDFLNSLDNKMKAKVFRTIDMLASYGFELREPFSKPLGDGIFELRAQVGNNISRVLYFFIVGSKAVLTNGFVKKTQKSPASEIELAKKYRADFLSREGNKND